MSELKELKRDINQIEERISDLIDGDLVDIDDDQWHALNSIQNALRAVSSAIIKLPD